MPGLQAHHRGRSHHRGRPAGCTAGCHERCFRGYIHLWASLPCTAGSPWQHLNKKYPSALKKIEENMDIFIKLIENFEKVAKKVVEQGGGVSFEWPTGCAL